MKELITSITQIELTCYLTKQLNNMFPDNQNISEIDLSDSVESGLKRISICFEDIKLPYYEKDGCKYFNHLHSDHYAMFLYFVSNSMYLSNGLISICEKIFLLNKAIHGIDAFYSVKLPLHFLFVHPLGTILGNADYGDYLVFYQGVTIGTTTEGKYPVFSNKCILYSNASIIGNCKLGDNVIIASNSSLINCNIEDNCTLLGQFPNNRIISNRNNLIKNYFNI